MGIELFQDLACPFSKRVHETLSLPNGVLDCVKSDPTLSKSVEFIFHNVPQPWHPQSCVMHEGFFALSCASNNDVKVMLPYISAAYKKFDEFTDLKTKNKTREEIHDMCVPIASEALGESVPQ